jgi:hypothetical protein
MPTRNPRVNVTLSPHQYDLLSRLAKSQSRSRSALLLELLETVVPVLERVVVITEAAQRVQVQAKEGLRASAERAEAAILPHVAEAMGQFDLLVDDALKRIGNTPGQSGRSRSPGAVRAGSAPPRLPSASPRPVTRGPGRGAKGPGKRSPGGRSPAQKRVRS